MNDRLNPLLGRSFVGITPLRVGGATGRIGEFGMTRRDGAGNPKKHNGLDLRALEGWPVFAAHDGVVTRAGWQNAADPDEGFGQRIYLEGKAYQMRTVYAHLLAIFAKTGQAVKAGERIGFLGRTGNVGDDEDKVPTHLHFEVHQGDGRGTVWVPIDPAGWLLA